MLFLCDHCLGWTIVGLESSARQKAPTEWNDRLLYVLNWLMWNTSLSLVDCCCLLATKIESGKKREKEKEKEKKRLGDQLERGKSLWFLSSMVVTRYRYKCNKRCFHGEAIDIESYDRGLQ